MFLYLMFFTISLKEISENMIFFFSTFVLITWVMLNKFNNLIYNNMMIMNLILILIILFLNSLILWKFYLLYEFIMIPMIIFLMSWGLNPARLSASLYLMVYMCLFSLPCLLVMIMNMKIFFTNMQHSMFVLNFFSKFMMVLMFLVKIPLFSLHYWLPKAHTEASTMGSIILASGLLKMGGAGFWKMILFLEFTLMNYSIIFYLVLFSSMVCLFQTDFKKMIALISVFHMSLSISIINVMSLNSYLSFIYLNMAHILSSSILFYFSGFLYSINKTRLIFMMMMNNNSKIFIFLIISILMNLGIPPFFTFFVEILSLSIMFLKNFFMFIFILFIFIFSAIFNLFIINMMKSLKMKSLKMNFFLPFYYFFFFSLMMWLSA
uniref:NADH-ubiquinone oxidoreductase chain 4 n=1 Tax=Romanomermis culicivorax TaxID=13658 RepID=A1EHF5_ROMCU|nr:NADH dehydrogenase subunit 4 [Romanomermis culicivorax]ABL11584.1 NADH dehydrogenase subunit 4 [Romanomermis culicivorax]